MAEIIHNTLALSSEYDALLADFCACLIWLFFAFFCFYAIYQLFFGWFK